jgi:hypothetical protein
MGSFMRAGRVDFFFPIAGVGVHCGPELSVLGLEGLDFLSGVFGLATPLGAAGLHVGDALPEAFEFEFEVGVFALPEIAAAAEEPGLDLLGCGVGGFSILLRQVGGGVHVRTPKEEE